MAKKWTKTHLKKFILEIIKISRPKITLTFKIKLKPLPKEWTPQLHLKTAEALEFSTKTKQMFIWWEIPLELVVTGFTSTRKRPTSWVASLNSTASFQVKEVVWQVNLNKWNNYWYSVKRTIYRLLADKTAKEVTSSTSNQK